MRVWVPIDLPDGATVRHVVIETAGSWQALHPGPIRPIDEEPAAEHYGKPAWAADPLPPALASRLPRWEYRVVGFTSTSASEAQAILNHMGQAGWQLVHGTPGALFFKRRLIP